MILCEEYLGFNVGAWYIVLISQLVIIIIKTFFIKTFLNGNVVYVEYVVWFCGTATNQADFMMFLATMYVLQKLREKSQKQGNFLLVEDPGTCLARLVLNDKFEMMVDEQCSVFMQQMEFLYTKSIKNNEKKMNPKKHRHYKYISLIPLIRNTLKLE